MRYLIPLWVTVTLATHITFVQCLEYSSLCVVSSYSNRFIKFYVVTPCRQTESSLLNIHLELDLFMSPQSHGQVVDGSLFK